MLVDRRDAIIDLLANTSASAKELSGLVADNEKQARARRWTKLNSVTAMLEKNRDNIGKALPGLAKYQITSGRSRRQRPLLQRIRAQSRIPELCNRSWTTPSASGAANAGADPIPRARAEFPCRYNGIPGGSR